DSRTGCGWSASVGIAGLSWAVHAATAAKAATQISRISSGFRTTPSPERDSQEATTPPAAPPRAILATDGRDAQDSPNCLWRSTLREDSFLGLSTGGFHRVAYTEWGDERDERLAVCVHGLTRNGRDFDELAKALQKKRRVACPDI